MPPFYGYEKNKQISFVTILMKWGPDAYIPTIPKNSLSQTFQDFMNLEATKLLIS